MCFVGWPFLLQRMIEFIQHNQDGGFYSRTFGVDSTCTVKTIGMWGRTVDKLIKFDLQTIQGTVPNVVILDIGSNDLCDERADPDTVALSILALVGVLLKDLHLQCLVLCKVFPRKKQPFLEYNERVWCLNGLLREAVTGIHWAKFWLHCSLCNPSCNIFTPDAI